MEQELLYTQEDIDEWMRTCEELQESLREKRADIKELEQENKQLKEQLTEQIDYKDEYYHYWKDTQKENTILKKALKLGCETIKQYIKIVFNEDYDFSYEHFIDKAKKELKGEKDE